MIDPSMHLSIHSNNPPTQSSVMPTSLFYFSRMTDHLYIPLEGLAQCYLRRPPDPLPALAHCHLLATCVKQWNFKSEIYQSLVDYLVCSSESRSVSGQGRGRGKFGQFVVNTSHIFSRYYVTVLTNFSEIYDHTSTNILIMLFTNSKFTCSLPNELIK